VRGRTTARAAREGVIVATRQYAKRQRTWFRHQIPAAQVTRIESVSDVASVRAAADWISTYDGQAAPERGNAA
jgi:tRNA dimethylallyltransferase